MNQMRWVRLLFRAAELVTSLESSICPCESATSARVFARMRANRERQRRHINWAICLIYYSLLAGQSIDSGK